MIKIKPSMLSIVVAAGVFSATPALADEFIDNGGINMTNSGPQGTLNGSGAGASMIGDTGGEATGGSQFNFDMDNGESGGGPFAARASGGRGTIDGPVGRSQAVMGDRSHQADKTAGNDYGDAIAAPKHNVNRRNVDLQAAFAQTITNNSKLNVLAPQSFDTSGVPSGQWNFGFQGRGGRGGPWSAGWQLPTTSTGSVDINTVSP